MGGLILGRHLEFCQSYNLQFFKMETYCKLNLVQMIKNKVHF